MAVFKYITRGEQTAQGKQKVYFCAHPNDYDIYFKKVANDILGTLEKENNRNCAFFYLEDANAERDDEFMFSLKEMNLIVIPVTYKLLASQNPAIDIEFKFAVKNKIPVLPLIMESELEDLFSKKFGAIQYLNPYSRDISAISYEEKLTKYLKSILIGDELAEKIRKAFDAYIFLSYRKKDRVYAQKLMQLIHSNDICRDIAIWYDEFLTPGENFNDSIKEALKKSQLFALAVTPSLLEKTKDKSGNECENYIVTTEYPMAKKAQMEILPAELIETDKNELALKYENIPECIKAEDQPTLSAALLKALKNIALRENDNDPQHNFFIGLAYLSGIDVEKDSDKALELITSAAEAGLAEAMEKLISIYRNGEIAQRDYIIATEWQKKLVNTRKSIYEKEHTEDAANNYLQSLENAANYLYELRYYDFVAIMNKYSPNTDCSNSTSEYYHIIDAKKIYTEMFSAGTEIYNKFKKSWGLKWLVSSLIGIGCMNQHLKNSEASEVYYLRALEISKKLNLQENTPETMYIVYTCHIKLGDLGDIYQRCNDRWELAKKHYLQAINIYEHNAKEIYFEKAIYSAEHVYHSLGLGYQNNDDPINAEKYYSKAAELSKILSDQNDNHDAKYHLWDILMTLGDICVSNNHLEKAKIAYIDALSLMIAISDSKNSTLKYTSLPTNYEKLCNVYKMQGLYTEAKIYCIKYLELKENYTNIDKTAEAKHELAKNYRDFGKYAYIYKDLDYANECYNKSLKITEEIAEKTNTNEAYDELAKTYFDIGLSAPHEQQEKYLNKAIEVWTFLSEKDSSNPLYIDNADYVKKILANISYLTPSKHTRKPSLFSKLFKKHNKKS